MVVKNYKIEPVKKKFWKVGWGFVVLFYWALLISGIVMGYIFSLYTLFPLMVSLSNNLLIGILLLVLVLVIMSAYYYTQIKKNILTTRDLLH